MNAGRLVKLTVESADAVRKHVLIAIRTRGVSHTMIGESGAVMKWSQISKALTLLGGPFALATLSTMMQQQAMRQVLDEIAQHLEVINENVDDICREQTDAVLANVISVDLIIEDALAVRGEVGRDSDVTWSKVQVTKQTLDTAQGYVLRKPDGVAAKLQRKTDVSDTARATREAEPKVRERLPVLASTFQLREGICVLQLGRLFDSASKDLEPYRIGLVKTRQNRRDRTMSATTSLLVQMGETVRKANCKVLMRPFDSPAAVPSSNKAPAQVEDLHALGDRCSSRDGRRQELGARHWRTF